MLKKLKQKVLNKKKLNKKDIEYISNRLLPDFDPECPDCMFNFCIILRVDLHKHKKSK